MARLENIMRSGRRWFHWVTSHTQIENVPHHPPKECMTSSDYVTIGSKILTISRQILKPDVTANHYTWAVLTVLATLPHHKVI